MNDKINLELPIFQTKLPENAHYVLDSYLMHIGTVACKNCGFIQEHSTVHEVWILPTNTARTAYRNLRPCTSLQQGFDLAITHLAEKDTPVCLQCVESLDQSKLPKPYTITSMSAWEETLKRKARENNVVRLEEVRKKAEPTLEML